MDGVNYSSIPGPRMANRALQWARGEVMVMDQLLAGEYFMGFVWCAGLSQRAAGHRSWFHGAVPALPSAECPKGLCSVSSSWFRGCPKDAARLLSASPAQQVTPDSFCAAGADKQCLGRRILAREEQKGAFWVGEFNLLLSQKAVSSNPLQEFITLDFGAGTAFPQRWPRLEKIQKPNLLFCSSSPAVCWWRPSCKILNRKCNCFIC